MKYIADWGEPTSRNTLKKIKGQKKIGKSHLVNMPNMLISNPEDERTGKLRLTADEGQSNEKRRGGTQVL